MKRARKWIKHIIKEGDRFHVISYDGFGRHCSEPNCEVNKYNELPTTKKEE